MWFSLCECTAINYSSWTVLRDPGDLSAVFNGIRRQQLIILPKHIAETSVPPKLRELQNDVKNWHENLVKAYDKEIFIQNLHFLR